MINTSNTPIIPVTNTAKNQLKKKTDNNTAKKQLKKKI
jgi:hypothetical protein